MEIEVSGLAPETASSRTNTSSVLSGRSGIRAGSTRPPPRSSSSKPAGSEFPGSNGAGRSEPPGRYSIPPPPSQKVDAERVGSFGELEATSPGMQATLGLLARYASTDVSMTLIGETGTGKEVLAHAIHLQSARSQGNFVVFDCGAVSPNLAESELLGHERGSFTGAVNAHPGAFERADNGTLFLDEIGELPLDLQPKLLRALENRKARRVGGKEDRPFDVRVIAATNRDLRSEVAAGRFRRDLYFRLGSAVVGIPPLRERIEDLPLLVESLLTDLGRRDLTLAPDALAMLRLRSWPGNVRELKNTLACSVAFVDATECTIGPQHLAAVFDAGSADNSDIERLPLGGLRLERIESVAIKQTLAQSGGNKVRAAQMLGIAVSTLYEKLKKYGQCDE